MNSLPQPGEFYRHFKNNLYQIVGIAKHSETQEKMVVYQALYGDYGLYVRPLTMFMSEVDHEKYPDVVQKYRFEKISMSCTCKKDKEQNDVKKEEASKEENVVVTITEPAKEVVEQPELEESKIDPNLLAFLEAETYSDKIEVLQLIKKHLTEEILQTIAISLDYTLGDGNLEDQYESVMYYLETHARYEGSRLR